MHGNELGTFIPPLMSWAIEFTITNISYDWPFVCGNHSIMRFEKKILLVSRIFYWFQNWSAQIGAVDENLVFPFFLDFGWWINEHWRPSICLSKLHMCENFDFLYLEFMFILEVVKVHWPDDKSLTMSLNANFETCLIWGVAHTTKDDWFCKGQLPHASKSIWSIVLLQNEEKFE